MDDLKPILLASFRPQEPTRDHAGFPCVDRFGLAWGEVVGEVPNGREDVPRRLAHGDPGLQHAGLGVPCDSITGFGSCNCDVT